MPSMFLPNYTIPSVVFSWLTLAVPGDRISVTRYDLRDFRLGPHREKPSIFLENSHDGF